jgi:putative ABC transport system permease protein
MAVDPTLRLHDLRPLDTVTNSEAEFYAFWLSVAVLVSLRAMLLGLSGIFSVMSFAVSRRTREIGIRRALGARPEEVVLAILRRPLAQVGVGVAIGTVPVVAAALHALRDGWVPGEALLSVGYGGVMVGVCMLAAIVPARRALKVQPTEALRTDA